MRSLGLQARRFGRAVGGQPDDVHLPAGLDAVEAEPGRLLSRELPRARSSARIGLQQVDRHEHVAAHRRAAAAGGVADHQRADADQLAVGVEEAGAAVVGACRRGEEGAVDVVFPVAGERPARDHAARG